MQWSAIVQSAAIGAVVASVVTAIINLVNTSRTMKFQGEENRKTLEHQAAQTRLTIEHQSELARLADQRALRDAKHERLRASYVSVIAGAQAMYNLMNDPSKFVPFDSDEELQKHRERTQRNAAAIADITRTLFAIQLETSTETFSNQFWQVATAYSNYRNYLKAHQNGYATVTDENLKSFRKSASDALEQMQAIARQQLAELEQPIGGTMQTGQATAQRSASTIRPSS